MLHAAASFEAAANSMTTMAANLNTTTASLNEAATSIRTAFTPFRPFQQHQDHYLFGIPMDVINPALLAAQQLDAQGVPIQAFEQPILECAPLDNPGAVNDPEDTEVDPRIDFSSEHVHDQLLDTMWVSEDVKEEQRKRENKKRRGRRSH